ncbi:AcrR family transcriptional regulator [Crossiella equi]|uniref:AcrR family transcriptional regulator n=1 Tax=Crossiella equi TaxID=130796 RepID=A0ABS5A9Q3_9PSEU|nr:TetR/AcrR family transcriptional regulator [Crossiella equi]MBP2473329.1 AcrR family transcriptional regulator [Crossiella equi]
MTTDHRPRKGTAEKRRAILTGARTVFGRDGYTRASIDSIAREAGVSTRTIYNHFQDKEDLFRSIILESTAQVRDQHLAGFAKTLDGAEDLAAALLACALDLCTPTEVSDQHYALVRQIQAEVNHVPEAVLEAWQDEGPRQIYADLARRLAAFADRGLLVLDNPERAALHFVLLATGELQRLTFVGARPMSAEAVRTSVTAGVAAFLRAYAPR